MLSVLFLYCYDECHYVDCRYAECRGAMLKRLPKVAASWLFKFHLFPFFGATTQSITTLRKTTLSIIINKMPHSVSWQIIVLLSVVMLNAIKPSVEYYLL
jgi:hypothetical protein